MNRPLEHAAAFAIALFFVPLKANVAGVSVYLADLIGIASLGFMGVALVRGRLMLPPSRVPALFWCLCSTFLSTDC